MSGANLSLFLLAALIIAAIPGPGIFYVAARTLSGGRQAGVASTFGTALGGLVHVIAGGLGVSAIILASAQLFTVLKLAGAFYLVWLGIKTFREAGDPPPEQIHTIGAKPAFREGVVVEALNPKTEAGLRAFLGRARNFAGAGAASGRSLAQHARVYPPLGVIELNLPRRARRLGGILIDRKAGRARPRHPR